MTQSDFSALVSSRICHDIISPLGAIGNGLELLELSLGQKGEEMSLISDSLRNATARVRLFQLAFGAASAGDAVSQDDIRQTLEMLNSGSRVQFHWQPTAPLKRLDVRAVLLAMLCTESALPRGGATTATAKGPGFEITTSHAALDLDPGLWGPLAQGGAPKVTGRSVHFALLPAAVHDAGRTMVLAHGPDHVTITL